MIIYKKRIKFMGMFVFESLNLIKSFLKGFYFNVFSLLKLSEESCLYIGGYEIE